MPQDIAKWLAELDLGQYAEVFAENAIDFRALAALTEEDLKELGVKLGHRRVLQQAVAALSDTKAAEESKVLEEPGLVRSTDDAERRQLSVMFCDLVGSTELSQKLEPEDSTSRCTTPGALARSRRRRMICGSDPGSRWSQNPTCIREGGKNASKSRWSTCPPPGRPGTGPSCCSPPLGPLSAASSCDDSKMRAANLPE